MGPLPGVVPVAFEAVDALEVGQVGGRQAACGHDQIFGVVRVAVAGRHRPPVCFLAELGSLYPGIQLDVTAQIETFGHVVDVVEDLGLGGVAFRPLPLAGKLVGELVGVLHALDVAARARVPVPEPGSADVAAGLEDSGFQTEAAQSVEHVQPGEARPDHDGVECLCAHLRSSLSSWLAAPLWLQILTHGVPAVDSKARSIVFEYRAWEMGD